MYVLILSLFLFIPIIQANEEEDQSFKNRFLSVSICHTFMNDRKNVSQSTNQTDPMLDICVQTLKEDQALLAIVRNLLESNSTFAQLEQCKSAKDNNTLSKVKPIWNKFTETIENVEWMRKEELCSLFTNKLNPLYCRLKKDNDKCELKMIGSVYAFWYLYAQTALNISKFEGCESLPHSLIKMKGNPLNPKLYTSKFDLKSDTILIGDVCMSHNLLWLSGKDKRMKLNSKDQRRIFGMGLLQFQRFGNSVYDL